MTVSINEYVRRRKSLMKQMGRNSIAILGSADLKVRNRDSEYPYRQDSDFYYLTGFNEPEAVLVLIPGRQEGEFVLFCRSRNAQMELWNGKRAGVNGARKDYLADEAYPIATLDELMPQLLQDKSRVYYAMGGDAAFDQKVLSWTRDVAQRVRAGVVAPNEFFSLDPLLHEMRLLKSRSELTVMRKAARISATAHKQAMKICQPGMYEYELEAEILYTFNRSGCRSPAYNTIVGGGKNACVLHYIENDDVLRDGDLVLIDAGAEYQGYAADITRTFPVNGAFSEPQRELYEIVLEAQLAAIKKVKPGNSWQDPHDAAVDVITRGLRELKLLKGRLPTLIKEKAYSQFFMHRTGHWLGMDVHDVGVYRNEGKWRRLQAGMVLTVEPGIYVRQQKGVPKAYWNIGIRIEDDVAVTTKGHEVLTSAVPKSVDEIERLMAS